MCKGTSLDTGWFTFLGTPSHHPAQSHPDLKNVVAYTGARRSEDKRGGGGDTVPHCLTMTFPFKKTSNIRVVGSTGLSNHVCDTLFTWPASFLGTFFLYHRSGHFPQPCPTLRSCAMATAEVSEPRQTFFGRLQKRTPSAGVRGSRDKSLGASFHRGPAGPQTWWGCMEGVPH